MKKLLLYGIVLLFACECKTDEIASIPEVKTIEPSTGSGLETVLKVEVSLANLEVDAYGFVWSEHSNGTKETTEYVLGESLSTSSFEVRIDNLLTPEIQFEIAGFVDVNGTRYYGNTVRYTSSSLINGFWDLEKTNASFEGRFPAFGTTDGRVLFAEGNFYQFDENDEDFKAISKSLIIASENHPLIPIVRGQRLYAFNTYNGALSLFNNPDWSYVSAFEAAKGKHSSYNLGFPAGINLYLISSDIALQYDLFENEWTELSGIPTTDDVLSISGVVHDNKGYLLLDNKEVWEFDPTNSAWNYVAEYPGTLATDMVTNSHDGYLYFGLGKVNVDSQEQLNTELWGLNMKTRKWEEKKGFAPRGSSINFFSYSLDDKLYIATGKKGYYDIWSFDPG